MPQWLQWQLSLRSTGGIREWHRLRSLGRVLSLWRMLAAGSSARRLVRNVCIQFRYQALARRSFGALREHRRWSSARTHRISQAIDRWVDARHQSRVRRALGVWRLRGAKGALRRRGANALSAFLTATRLRRWLTGWSSLARRERRRAQALSILVTRTCTALGCKACKVWRAAARRSIAARLAAAFLEAFRTRNIIRRWAGQRKAEVYRSRRLFSAAWRGFTMESKRTKAESAVRRRGCSHSLRSAWQRWSIATVLKAREAICQQRAKTRRLGVTLRSWQSLKAAKAFAAHSTLLVSFRKWNRIVGHLFNERHARELMVGVGCSSWRRDCTQLSRRFFAVWGQVVQSKRRQRRRVREAKEALQKLATVQALWFWHGRARESSMREDHLTRASIALQAMVSTSRWARAHDLLIRWFVRSKATRIMCSEADLSGEAPSAISLEGSGMSEATAPRTPRPRPRQERSGEGRITALSTASSKASMLIRHMDTTCASPTNVEQGMERLSEPSSEQRPRISCSERLPPASALARWLKFTVTLQQVDAAALPVLQWACSAWRGAHLHAKLHHLRWWAFALKMRRLRVQGVRRDVQRLRIAFKAWFEAVAEQLQEAVAAAEAELRAISEAGLAAATEPLTQMAPKSCQDSARLEGMVLAMDVDFLVWAFSSWAAWARLTRT
ncbi:DGAT2 [Symbiodinium sp. CCMP2592]|nr:DGAT2 [Symbiodinium sp. CCMP2592]